MPPPSASQAKPQSFASTSMKRTGPPSVTDNVRNNSAGPGIVVPSTRQWIEDSIAATPPSAMGVTPHADQTPALTRVAGQLLPVDPERLAPKRQYVVVILPAPIPGQLDNNTAARLMGHGALPVKTTFLCASDRATGGRPPLEQAGLYEISDSLDSLSDRELAAATRRVLTRAGVALDWSLTRQLDPSVYPLDRTLTKMDAGSVLHAIRLPRSPTAVAIDYPDAMGVVARHAPSLLTPLRALVMGGKSAPAWDHLPPHPPPAAPTSPNSLSNYLADETKKSLAKLDIHLRELHVVLDPDDPTGPTVYAISGQKAWAQMVKWVGVQVRAQTLDQPSSRLFLSVLRRHDRYLPTFGDIPYESLELEYGP